MAEFVICKMCACDDMLASSTSTGWTITKSHHISTPVNTQTACVLQVLMQARAHRKHQFFTAEHTDDTGFVYFQASLVLAVEFSAQMLTSRTLQHDVLSRPNACSSCTLLVSHCYRQICAVIQ